jgi:hydrogenase maturation factor
MTEAEASSAIKLVSNNEIPAEPVDEKFKVARGWCNAIAMRMGKTEIDTEVIRQYFFNVHSAVVDELVDNQRELNLKDPPDRIRCKIRTGTVVAVNNETAIVETPNGDGAFKTLFAKDVKKGDRVIVHLDFIIEKVTAEVEASLSAKSVLP